MLCANYISIMETAEGIARKCSIVSRRPPFRCMMLRIARFVQFRNIDICSMGDTNGEHMTCKRRTLVIQLATRGNTNGEIAIIIYRNEKCQNINIYELEDEDLRAKV